MHSLLFSRISFLMLSARLLFLTLTLLPLAGRAAEVPFVAKPDPLTLAMLRVAKVHPNDYLIALGAGDGRIPILAAKRFGARALGIESQPQLVQQGRTFAAAANVAHKVEFRTQDPLGVELSQASVITLALPAELGLRLRPALLDLAPGTRVVSHGTDMGDWRPDRVLSVASEASPPGEAELSRVYLWTVPLRVGGQWCGTGAQRGVRLDIEQRFQDIEGRLQDAQRTLHFGASLSGARMQGHKGEQGRADFVL